jgi:hypothetical protein
MSPVLFAQSTARQLEHPAYNMMLRVRFEDDRLLQRKEAPREWTGHDTLLLGLVGSKGALVVLWIDTGVGGIPVASIETEEPTVQFTDCYRELSAKDGWRLPADDLVISVLKDAFEHRDIHAMR